MYIRDQWIKSLKKGRCGFSFLWISWTIVFLSGCGDIIRMPSESAYNEKLVVNGLLIAGMPVDSIRINRTADITEPYDPVSSAVTGALVILEHNGITDTLTEYTTRPGIYYHPDRSYFVEKGVTYRLTVSDSLHESVVAETTVPGEMSFNQFWDSDDQPIRDIPDTLTYIPAGEDAQFLYPRLFSFSLSQPEDTPSPPAMMRILNISLDASKETMITEDDSLKAFIFKWHGLSTEDEDLRKRIITKASQSFNSVNPDATYMMSWTFYGFYGRQVLIVLSLDEAYYNYHKGNLEGPPRDPHYLPESNIVGGYGLFCSGATGPESTRYYYLKRP